MADREGSYDGSSPFVVVWESTKACDYACKHCRANAIKYRSPDELTTSEAKRLIEDISDSGVKLFVISGGDPMKREDIFELLAFSSSHIRTAFSPSGARINRENARLIKEAGIDTVSISLDGTETVHDSFRCFEGSYKMSVSSIGYLKEAGIGVQINTTISRFNIGLLNEIKDIVLSMHVSMWDIFMLVPTGRARVGMMISPEEAELVMRTVAQWRINGINVRMTCAPYLVRIMNDFGLSPVKPDSLGRKSLNGARGCMAGNGYVFISSDGSVMPCGYLPVRIGNVKSGKLLDIYRSDSMAKFRKPADLLGKCGMCEYRTVCGGCRARSFSISGDAFGEDPFCVYMPKGLRYA
ncbi:MAG: radical SAM protein [Thermoplasmata archaeon]|jgi:radical SAM protein with 4Fe4S-binding SPASM domain|nr:radical SAM protein [Candidatus Sysuiplasma jiujiangense]